MDLLEELNHKQKQLNISLKELRKNGSEYAKAEKEYKILLRQEVLKLREQGEAIGVIQLICYGIPEVAEKRFKRDVAEAIYKANQEAINTLKLEIKLIENQLSREYTNVN